jgi:hypothetical protein
MKKLILFVFLFLSILNLIAQNRYKNARSLHEANLEPGEGVRTRRVPQSFTMRPVYEIDSVYDVPSATWLYDGEKTHTYYQDNCLDSVVTKTYLGTNNIRYTHKYENFPPYNYEKYYLEELWNGSSWDSSYLFIGPSLPIIKCYYDYTIDQVNLGSGWDTITGRRTSSYQLDSWNNPVFIQRQRMFNNVWISFFRYDFSYDSNHRLTTRQYSDWDTTSLQYIPTYRMTNYTYSSYNSICDFAETSYEYETWDSSQWVKQYKTFIYRHAYSLDTLYYVSWNGSSYSDTLAMMLRQNNDLNKTVGSAYYLYSDSGSWNLSDYDWHFFSYDINNNIIRDYNENNYFAWPAIDPNSVARFSNFQPCSHLQGIPSNSYQDKIKIYPNPAHFSFSINETGELRIYDTMGKLVFQKTLIQKNETIPCILSSGIYFVMLSADKTIFSGKLLVE